MFSITFFCESKAELALYSKVSLNLNDQGLELHSSNYC